MNNFNKKNFAGQNFGQQRAAENVAECATETVTTEVAGVANNKSAFMKIATSKVTLYIVAGLAVVGLSYGYKKFFGGKKKAAETTTADPQNDFEEAK